jgi:hypothetical protein
MIERGHRSQGCNCVAECTSSDPDLSYIGVECHAEYRFVAFLSFTTTKEPCVLNLFSLHFKVLWHQRKELTAPSH